MTASGRATRTVALHRLSADRLIFEVTDAIKVLQNDLARHNREGLWDLVEIDTERVVHEERTMAGYVGTVEYTTMSVTVPFLQREEPEASAAPGSTRDTSATSSD